METRWNSATECQPVPFSENSRSRKAQLAIAIGQGTSITAWARKNHVPRRTANRWASEPKVRAAVESCRRRALDRAIGRLAKGVTWAADGIAKLAKDAVSESVRLAALRAIFSSMTAVSEFAGLEERMTQIEEQLRDGTGNTARNG
jgi:hypothetical protein